MVDKENIDNFVGSSQISGKVVVGLAKYREPSPTNLDSDNPFVEAFGASFSLYNLAHH